MVVQTMLEIKLLKKIDVFSSKQPEGLMTKLMGENMMRKDGKAHQKERKVISSSVSPKTVKEIWLKHFNDQADQILTKIKPLGAADLIEAYAKPLSGEALKLVTGLTNMSYQEMDRVSQGMIDGCANYAGDKAIEENCHDCTRSCLLYTSPSPRDKRQSRMPSSA